MPSKRISPRGRLLQAGEATREGGLSGPRLPDERDRRSAADVEVDARQRLHRRPRGPRGVHAG